MVQQTRTKTCLDFNVGKPATVPWPEPGEFTLRKAIAAMTFYSDFDLIELEQR